MYDQQFMHQFLPQAPPPGQAAGLSVPYPAALSMMPQTFHPPGGTFRGGGGARGARPPGPLHHPTPYGPPPHGAMPMTQHGVAPHAVPSHRPPSGPQVPHEVGESSRVVHLRNVTPDVSQLSIQNLVNSFGRIRHLVMLRQKNQALVEMETQASAQQMVDFFKDPGFAEIDGRRVYVRFSTHKELTATQHSSKTLLVSMFNTHYDVSAAAQITPSIVFQIFGSYGAVEKIVVLPKNESSSQNHHRVQALVQFENKETAEEVKSVLQGQPVTLGETVTFTLDIQFSKMEEIKASSPHNSLVIPKPNVPSGEQPMGHPGPGGASGAPGQMWN